MAQTIYSSGTHTHTASVAGDPADMTVDPEVSAEIAVWIIGGCTVTITAGTITGGDSDAPSGEIGDGPAPGVQCSESDLTITGGTIAGGSWGVRSGAPGLNALNPTALSITGGTVTGGDSGSDCDGGTALSITVDGVNATISGGTFTGGAGSGTGGAGYSLGLSIAGGADVEVSGGIFTGDWAVNLESGSTLTVYGLFDTATGSAISGTLDNTDAIDVAIVSLGAALTTTGSQPPNGVRYYT